MSKLNWLQLFVIFIILMGCNQTHTVHTDDVEKEVRNKAQEFFETFAQRSDWDKFCSFYSENVHFKDIILQLDLDSLWKLKRFYKWDQEVHRFKKMSPEQKHLTLESLVVDGNTVAGKGHLNPFYYDGELIDSDWGMEFTIWLRFDQNLKIIEQVDWMEYDLATLENTIKRCRENGFEATPDWLDLSMKEVEASTH